MNLKSQVNELYLLFGPLGLVVSLGLYFFPNFDDIEVPKSKNELSPIVGTIINAYSTAHKGIAAHFIVLKTSSGSETLKVLECCLGKYKGMEVDAMVYPDFLKRWFDVAWEVKLTDGQDIYTYESQVRQYENRLPSRKNFGKWGILIGIFVTPFWCLRKRQKNA